MKRQRDPEEDPVPCTTSKTSKRRISFLDAWRSFRKVRLPEYRRELAQLLHEHDSIRKVQHADRAENMEALEQHKKEVQDAYHRLPRDFDFQTPDDLELVLKTLEEATMRVEYLHIFVLASGGRRELNHSRWIMNLYHYLLSADCDHLLSRAVREECIQNSDFVSECDASHHQILLHDWFTNACTRAQQEAERKERLIEDLDYGDL